MIIKELLIKNHLKNSVVILFLKIVLIIFIFDFIFIIYKRAYFIINYKNNITINENYLLKYYNHLEDMFGYFHIIDIKFVYSNKYQIIKVEYKIKFFDLYKNLILPSDLTLYKKMHIFCHLEIINSKLKINSLANIIEDKFFNI